MIFPDCSSFVYLAVFLFVFFFLFSLFVFLVRFSGICDTKALEKILNNNFHVE